MATLKPQSNRLLYSNTVIRTLAVDGCSYIQWYVTGHWLHLVQQGGAGRAAAAPSPLLTLPILTPTHQRPVYQFDVPL